MGLECTALASKMKVLPIVISLVCSQSKATENFTSLRVPEWWQGLAEVFKSATWARLHNTTGDQHLRVIASKLTSFLGLRVMSWTDVRSTQLSSEKVSPQHPKPTPIPLAALELKTPLAAGAVTKFADRSCSGLQLSINQLSRAFSKAQTTPLIMKQGPEGLTKLEIQ